MQRRPLLFAELGAEDQVYIERGGGDVALHERVRETFEGADVGVRAA